MMLNTNNIYSKIVKTAQYIWSALTDFSCVYTSQENMQKLSGELHELGKREHDGILTKNDIIRDSLYRNIFFSDRKFPKDKEAIIKKYYKIVPYIFELGYRRELSLETFNAKEVAKIMVELLYLKKDELDKVDGGLPVV